MGWARDRQESAAQSARREERSERERTWGQIPRDSGVLLWRSQHSGKRAEGGKRTNQLRASSPGCFALLWGFTLAFPIIQPRASSPRVDEPKTLCAPLSLYLLPFAQSHRRDSLVLTNLQRQDFFFYFYYDIHLGNFYAISPWHDDAFLVLLTLLLFGPFGFCESMMIFIIGSSQTLL